MRQAERRVLEKLAQRRLPRDWAVTHELARELYKNGVTDFQNVLDSQRSLFLRQDELAASEGQVATNLVNLYRALGGGWAAEEGTDFSEDEQN